MSSQNTWELIRNGDTTARNEMWEKHQEAVDYVARRVASSLPKHVTFEDLKSAGQLGLLDAITKFDPDRGFKFETYALTRIRGSILDDLRSQDWVPRSVRQMDRNIETATQELTQYYGRNPTNEELAGFLEVDIQEIHKARATNASSAVFNIDQPVDEDGSITVADSISSDLGDPSELLAAIDLDGVVDALDGLPDRERLTMAMHYCQGMTLAEIGRQFGVTESRVCQIHTKALKTIRQEMIT